MSNNTIPTLFAWLQVWLGSHSHNVQETTAQNYAAICRIIEKWLPDCSLDSLREMEVQKTLNLLADIGYSRSTLRIFRIVLRKAYEWAIRNQLVTENPIRYVTIPKNASEKGVFPLHREQQERLEAVCRDDLHGDLFLFLLYTGLRRAELCNLKWRDFDAQKRCIHIRKSKTAAGIRTVPLLSLPLSMLYLQPRINEYIFNSTKTQKPVTPSVLRRTYLRLREKAGIPELTNHVCRHTFATRLLENGVEPKAIAALLGHTNVAFTLNRYVQAQPEYLTQQIFRLDNHASCPIV